jgi:rhamnosyltransferase
LFVEYVHTHLLTQAVFFMSPSTSLSPSKTAAVCSVVVTFNPCIDKLRSLLESLNASGHPFLVVDNASSNIDQLYPWLTSLPACLKVEKMSRNVGQAAALNHALVLVANHGYELALLFDQDSHVTDSFVDSMLEAWHAAQRIAPGKVAAVGPRLVDPRNAQKMPFRLFNRLFERSETQVLAAPRLYEAAFLITSGSIIGLAPLVNIGNMREDYFIDNVDMEWCFRARHHGFRLFGTDYVHMTHQIGEDSSSFWVRSGLVVQHSPQRYYYSTRNRLHLHQQGYAPWIWRIKDMVRFVLKSMYLFFTSSNRVEYWTQLKKALKDFRQLS